jgi:hypothetical protein
MRTKNKKAALVTLPSQQNAAADSSAGTDSAQSRTKQDTPIQSASEGLPARLRIFEGARREIADACAMFMAEETEMLKPGDVETQAILPIGTRRRSVISIAQAAALSRPTGLMGSVVDRILKSEAST